MLDKSKSGSITTNGQTVILDVRGMAMAAISLGGTFTGTLQFEGTLDDTTYFAITATPITGGSTVTSATATGQWQFNVAGFKNIRVRASATITGTVEIVLNAISNGIDQSLSRAISASGGFLPYTAVKRITFDGGTSNAIGDDGGSLDPFTIFNVTGDVIVAMIAIVRTDLVGAASLEVGVPGSTGEIMNTISDVTVLDVNEAWYGDTSPNLAKSRDSFRYSVIGGGLDIIGTVGTTDITAGVMDFFCMWRPLSSDGAVVAA